MRKPIRVVGNVRDWPSHNWSWIQLLWRRDHSLVVRSAVVGQWHLDSSVHASHYMCATSECTLYILVSKTRCLAQHFCFFLTGGSHPGLQRLTP